MRDLAANFAITTMWRLWKNQVVYLRTATL